MRPEVSGQPDTERIVRLAIKTRRLLAILYEGQTAPRMFAPYVLLATRGGEIMVYGKQILGRHDDMGGDNTPQAFDLARMRSVQLTGDRFAVDRAFFDPQKFRNGVLAIVKGR